MSPASTCTSTWSTGARGLALFALLLLAACAHRGDVFDPEADVAALEAELGAAVARPDAPPDALERAAWLALLHGGRADQAAAWLDRAWRARSAEAAPAASAASAAVVRLRFGLALAEELLARPEAAVPHWAALLGGGRGELRRLAAWRLLAAAAEGWPGETERAAARAALDARPLDDAALSADLRAALDGAAGPPPGTVERWRVWPRLAELPRVAFAAGAPAAPMGAGATTRSDGAGWLRFDRSQTGWYTAAAALTVAEAAEVELTLESPLSARVRVDGRLALERDALRGFPSERVRGRLRLPAGTHRLSVEAAVDQPAEGVRVRVVPLAAGRPPAAVVAAAAPAGAAPADVTPAGDPATALPLPASEGFDPPVLAHVARAWRLVEAGRPIDAQEALVPLRERAPEAAALEWLTARAARSDPSVPPGMAVERELNALQRAVLRDPSLAVAHARLAELLVDEGRSEEALGHVSDGEAVSPDSGRWDRLRYQVFLDRGWEPEARTALARALRRDPQDCGLARRRLDLDWESLRLRPWEPLPAALRGCPTLRRAEAAFHQQGGEPAAAAELWRALAAAPGGTVADRRAMAQALLVAGRHDEALAAFEALVTDAPDDLDLRLALAEAYRLAGRPGDAAAERARIEARPEGDPEVRRRLLYLTDDPFFGDHVVDGPARVAESREAGERLGRDADAVILLDQQVSRFYGDGRATHYAHALILLRTQRGAETFGEVRVPEGVEVLVARTIQADGRLEEPEERADKETLSMPALSPGDTIDYAWLRQAPAKAYARPDVLSDTFFLQSYQAPILRSEWTVATAPDLPLVVEQHGALPQPVTRRLDGPGGGLVARTWARTGAEVVRAEPDIPDARETLPYVRVGTIDWPTLAARITDDVLPLRRPGPLGEAVAAQIAAETADPEARTRAAWAAVRELVADETDAFFETPAAHTFAEGRGERLFALAGLLDRLGVPNDLVLAKPVNRAAEDGPVPDPLAYSYGLLRVRLPAREVWLDPSLRHMPFDALPPVVQDRPALLVSAAAPGEALTTPPGDLERQLRRVALTLEVLPGGGGLTGEGREELHGIQAVSLRQAFEEATDDERRAAVTTLVRASVPRARLLELHIDHLDDPERPLVLRYRLAAELTPPTVPGPPQRVTLGLLPESYAASWAQLPVRHHPLFFNVAIRQSLDLTVVLPDAADLARVPPGQKLATDYGTHETKIWSQRGADGRARLRVRKELKVPLAVVPPADYARFAGACRGLDRADRLDLDVRWRR